MHEARSSWQCGFPARSRPALPPRAPHPARPPRRGGAPHAALDHGGNGHGTGGDERGGMARLRMGLRRQEPGKRRRHPLNGVDPHHHPRPRGGRRRGTDCHRGVLAARRAVPLDLPCALHRMGRRGAGLVVWGGGHLPRLPRVSPAREQVRPGWREVGRGHPEDSLHDPARSHVPPPGGCLRGLPRRHEALALRHHGDPDVLAITMGFIGSPCSWRAGLWRRSGCRARSLRGSAPQHLRRPVELWRERPHLPSHPPALAPALPGLPWPLRHAHPPRAPHVPHRGRPHRRKALPPLLRGHGAVRPRGDRPAAARRGPVQPEHPRLLRPVRAHAPGPLPVDRHAGAPKAGGEEAPAVVPGGDVPVRPLPPPRAPRLLRVADRAGDDIHARGVGPLRGAHHVDVTHDDT